MRKLKPKIVIFSVYSINFILIKLDKILILIFVYSLYALCLAKMTELQSLKKKKTASKMHVAPWIFSIAV